MKRPALRQNGEQKRKTFILICVLMVIITLMLGFSFGAQLLGFELPLTFLPFKAVVMGMVSPLEFFFRMVSPLFSPNLNAGLPKMPVAQAFSMFTGKPVGEFSQVKGTIDWLTFFAIPFWQSFLILVYYCSWYLRENLSFTEVQSIIQEAVVESRQNVVNPQGQPKTSIFHQESAASTQSTLVYPVYNEPGMMVGSDSKIKDRLSDSKNLSHKAPQVQKYTHEDWERYKDREGQMMVQDMVRQLRTENMNLQAQKNDLQSTFSQYFSPEVLKYLEQNQQSFEMLQNQRRTMSVLFCDLRGFSSYSQSASSEEMVAYLSEYFEIASYCVLHKYNGVISKLMGDGFMAYWGFPMENRDHAYTATQAALTILREVQLRNELKPLLKPIQVGIGIATGDVMVGNIGSMDFKDFTLIGVPVNLASRLQEASKTLGTELVISQNTYEDLKGRLPCHPWGETEIRGWQNLEAVYTPFIPEHE